MQTVWQDGNRWEILPNILEALTMKKPNERANAQQLLKVLPSKLGVTTAAILHNINYTDGPTGRIEKLTAQTKSGQGGLAPVAGSNELVNSGTFAPKMRPRLTPQLADLGPDPLPLATPYSPELEMQMKVTSAGLVLFYRKVEGEQEHALAALRRELTAKRAEPLSAAKQYLAVDPTKGTFADADVMGLWTGGVDPKAGKTVAKPLSGAAAGGAGTASHWKTVRKWVGRLETWISSFRLYRAGVNDPIMREVMKTYYLTAITLTLPAGKQLHTDQHLYRYGLQKMLTWLKKAGVRNYFWKAETTKEGCLHYHLIIDRFIKKGDLQRGWNTICAALGYPAFADHYKSADGAPSTFIEAVRWSDDLTGYLIDYITKGQHDGRRAVVGRLMGCSDSLKDYTPWSAPVVATTIHVLNRAAVGAAPVLVMTSGDWHTNYRLANRQPLKVPGQTKPFWRRPNFITGFLRTALPHLYQQVCRYYFTLAKNDYKLLTPLDDGKNPK